jgi:hypothetical protein
LVITSIETIWNMKPLDDCSLSSRTRILASFEPEIGFSTPNAIFDRQSRDK